MTSRAPELDDSRRAQCLTELEFELSDPRYFFVSASHEASCRIHLETLVRRADGRLLELFSVHGGPVSAVREVAEDADGIDVGTVSERAGGGVVEVTVSGPCIAETLGDNAAIYRSIRASSGTGRVIAHLLPSRQPRRVVEAVRDEHPAAELVANRSRELSALLLDRRDFRNLVARRLTDRQLDALETAYRCGYFERPRETTGEEVARRMGIAPATLSQHLRASQAKLLSLLFEDALVGEALSDADPTAP